MADSTTLKPVTVDKTTLDDIKINGFLNGMSYALDAQGIVLKDAGFWNGKEYVSGLDEHGKVDPKRVTDESIRRVSLKMDDGTTRYFKQKDWSNGEKEDPQHYNASGAKITAWEETDKAGNVIKVNGKEEIRISDTGYLPESGTDWASHLALLDVMNGKLNPQAEENARFVDKVIHEVGKDNISDIKYSSHSFGAGLTMAADVVSRLEGVKTDSLLHMESAVASGQKEALETALRDINSPFSKEVQKLLHADGASDAEKKAISERAIGMLEDDLQHKTTSVQAIRRDEPNGDFHGGKIANTHPVTIPLSDKELKLAEKLGPTAVSIDQWLLGTESAIAGGTVFAWDSIAKKMGLEKDSVVSDDHHNHNTPQGRVLLEEVRTDPDYVTTSMGGKLDNLHQLYPLVNQAKQGAFYEVVHADPSKNQVPNGTPKAPGSPGAAIVK